MLSVLTRPLRRYIAYWRLPEPKALGWPATDVKKTAIELRERGYHVYDFWIDDDKYHRFLRQARYDRFLDYYRDPRQMGRRTLKMLQHYIAAELLNLSSRDIYIDVAAGDSPVFRIYRELFHCRSYRQDQRFSRGVHNDTIGGDASHLPLPPNSVTALGMHSSFEHFEGNRDSAFMMEAERVLRPGGRLCIIPLHIAREYAILTDLDSFGDKIPLVDRGATLRGIFNYHGVSYSRYYDIPHFLGRVVENAKAFRLTIYLIFKRPTLGLHHNWLAAVFLRQ